ncbi:oligosaccharide repeat unit polymerase [Rhodoferax sp. PAMC 29310]|uniref:oligosaccharide repeat unit polymerase n=1 Tax=Rhodoferax sp. PAMC 29310 TaxID=2822760 RepID=UPI001B326CE2|nr:oligosaccharide repeat unit polymerase [Rhodoferax sp. PAMC 29310]
MKIYWPWLFLYVFSNILAALIIWNTGELIGDLSGISLYSRTALLWATTLVVLSYIAIMWPVFKFISKLKIKKINFCFDDDQVGKRIGKLLLVLQISFMIFNISTGVNIAGSSNRTEGSLFSMLWVFIPTDALFFIYYGMHRENKYFYPNLIIWLLSNILRGWVSVLLFVIFFEWCRAIRNKKITTVITAFIGVAIIIVYPVVTNIKWIFRASANSNLSLTAMAADFFDVLRDASYITLIGDGISHLIGRFQVTSVVIEVMRLSDFLQTKLASGQFTTFWLEGFHGIVLSKLFPSEKYMSAGVAFTKYGDFGSKFEVGDWTTNIGYVGWFFIAPYLIPIYLAYTLLLGFISFYLVKKIGISESAKDMLWLAWLVYLMPPWFAAFTGFIYTLFLFLCIKFILTRLPSFRLLPRVVY